MTIALYAFDTPNGRKISVALEEMGLPYEVHVVDITKGEQNQPEFLKISPNNKIPAIVDPQGPTGAPVSVFESGAILIYLAEKSGRFLPQDPLRRIAALEWLMFQMGGFGPMPGQVHHFIALANETDRRYGLERFMAETRRLYGVMDRRLGEIPYLAGDFYSIADMASYGWASLWEGQQQQLDDKPHLARWLAEIGARPAVQRGMAVGIEKRRPGFDKDAQKHLFKR